MRTLVRIATTTAAVAMTLGLTTAQEPAPGTQQPTMEDLERRIAELERKQAETFPENWQQQPQARGTESQVPDRNGLYDRQDAAARPGDVTLDPEYRGFMPVPNTPMFIRFNAKPRLDATFDNRNTGYRYRFVPSQIPVEGAPDYGGGLQSNLNANGTQLNIDVRAPDSPGKFRFYYENDFFGSDTANMQYRLKHAYGQAYNIVAGFTFGLFEDPDIWPDTVDFEDVNALIFARRPVLHYLWQVEEDWIVTFGVEQPGIYVDDYYDPDRTTLTKLPDFGFNVRWEERGTGHAQFSTLFRTLGAKGPMTEEQNVFGWGVNLSLALDITESTYFQTLGVVGEGVGGLGNDTSFGNNDAAFTLTGDLEALPYYSGLLAFTHRWCDEWRSTATYGYVQIDNTSGQSPDAFHSSQYASANVIWQLGPNVNVGAEILWGDHEVNSGDRGDAFRFQLSLVYSLF